jgi:hypothetical protein
MAITDREFIEHTLQWLKLSAEVAPFVQKRVVIDSIEQHLGESRRVPPSTTIINESPLQAPVYGVPAGFEINYSPGVEWGRNNPSPYQTFTLTGMPQAPQQITWRCEHYPSALENFFDGRQQCEFNCNLSELRWNDNGTHPTPA